MTAAVFVYDDDCGFCTWCAETLERHGDVEIVGFSVLSEAHRGRLPDDYESCSHLLTDEGVYSCGAAIEQALARTDIFDGAGDVFEFLRQFRDYERFRERLYREAADRRGLLGRVVSTDRDDPKG